MSCACSWSCTFILWSYVKLEQQQHRQIFQAKMKFLTGSVFCIHSDLIEYILNSQDLNTPSLYLKRYTTPVDIVLESGKTVIFPLLILLKMSKMSQHGGPPSRFLFYVHLSRSKSNFRKRKNLLSFIEKWNFDCAFSSKSTFLQTCFAMEFFQFDSKWRRNC